MKITDITGGFALHNGIKMPYLGLGVFNCNNGQEVINALEWAFDTGYRHIDTASIYGNEEGVGKAIRQCGINRYEIFVVSKVWGTLIRVMKVQTYCFEATQGFVLAIL